MRSPWIILLALLVSSPALAQDAVELSAAREAASTGDHRQSIELFTEAFEASPELRDQYAHELGDQLTWADRPGEAIDWYLLRLEAWPIDTGARLGLARALSWTNQLEQGWFQYRVVYYLDDGNLEARRGEARMLAWMDQLDESLGKYDAILVDHPGDIPTRIERAQVINWNGEHFRAARLYEEILQDDPGNPEAMVGLAQALRWSGQERQAMNTLDPIRENPAAAPIYRDLEFAARPVVELTGGWARDTDELEVLGTNLSWTGTAPVEFLNRPRSRLNLLHENLSQPGQPEIENWGISAGGAGKTSLRTTLNAYLGLKSFSSDGAIVDSGRTGDLDWTLLTWDAWWTWMARHDLRVDLSTDRNYVQTHRAMGNQVSFSRFAGSADWRMSREWTLTGVLGEGFYSDDNRQTSTQLRARWQRNRRLSYWVSPRLSAFWISDPQDRGYWNPEDFYSVGVDVGVTGTFARILTPRLSLGSSREYEAGEGYGVFAVSAGLAWRIARTWELDLSGGTSDSRLSTSSGFGRDWASLSLRWRY